MARTSGGAIRVDGLGEAVRAIRKTQDKELKRSLREANKGAATVVATAARPKAPTRTGRLAKSVGVKAGQKDAAVKAGTASRVPYAGPVHYGWPARHIAAQPFILDALKARKGEVRTIYAKSMDDLAEQLSAHLGAHTL